MAQARSILNLISRNLTIKKADPSIIFDSILAGDTDFWMGVVDDAGGDDDDLFQIGKGTTPGTTPYVTIDKDGKVGIGVTPTEEFEVGGTNADTFIRLSPADAGTVNQAGIEFFQGANRRGGLLAQSTIGAGTQPGVAGDMVLYSQSGITITAGGILQDVDHVFISSTGNVGIGTVTPFSKLGVADTNKTVASGNANLFLETTDAQAVDIGPTLAFIGRYIDASQNTVPFAYIWGRKENSTSSSQNGYLALGTRTGAGANERLRIDSAGSIGIGTTVPTNLLSLGGNSARIFWMERHTTANTAGNSLTVQGGGATAGATDKDGGSLLLVPGVSTGTGRNNLRLQGHTTALATGTADNVAIDVAIFNGFKALSDGADVALVNCTLANNTAVAGVVRYAVEVFDGTDIQVEEGVISYHATNKAGVIANNTTVKFGNQQAMTAGTLTVTWTITAANPAVLTINANSSLTPSAGYPRVRYVVENLTSQAIAIQ